MQNPENEGEMIIESCFNFRYKNTQFDSFLHISHDMVETFKDLDINPQIYEHVELSSTKLLSPSTKYNVLDVKESNLFTYSYNGINYGFYVIQSFFTNSDITFNLYNVDFDNYMNVTQ